MTDLYQDGARFKFPGAEITGTGAWALVRHRFNQSPVIRLFTGPELAKFEQSTSGGQIVQITPAKRLPPPDLGWE